MSGRSIAVKRVKLRRLDLEMQAKGYLNAVAAAEALRVNLSTLHVMCADGRLEHVRVGGDGEGRRARVFVSEKAVREYMGAAAKILKV